MLHGKETPVEEWKEHREHLEVASPEASPGAVKPPSRMLTPAEEDKLYRKLDWRLMPILTLLYLLSFMDRGNIGNAKLSGLLPALKMSSQDYATALSVYFVSYNLFEVPSNLLLKKLRPGLWLPLIVIAWSIVMTLMGVVQTKGGLYATRFLLGVTESGLFPGVIFYLSLWYPRHRCNTRFAIFFGGATLAGAFSGLLAYGIGFLQAGFPNDDGQDKGWRWIFIIEGLMTFAAGILAYFAIVDYPETAKFLTAEEKEFIIWRLAIDKGSAGEDKTLKKSQIWSAVKDPQVWLSIGYYFSVVTPLYGVSLFLPSIIASFGQFNRAQSQLLTVPVYAVACAWVLISAILSDRWRKRWLFVAIDQVLCFIGLLLNITNPPSGVRYLGMFFFAMGAYGGLPAVVTWLANNLSGQTRRGVGSAMQIGIGNFGGLIASNVYRSKDAPHYTLGHAVEIGLVLQGLLFTAPAYAWWLRRENARKRAQLELEAGKRVYTVQELHELGDRAPEFEYTI